MFRNRPWKGWKTRKIAFIIVALVWLIYAGKGLTEMPPEEVMLDFIYKAGVWILSFGIILVCSDKITELLLQIHKKKKGDEE